MPMTENKNDELETDDPFASRSSVFRRKILSHISNVKYGGLFHFNSEADTSDEKATPKTSRINLVQNKFHYYIDEIGVLNQTNPSYKFRIFLKLLFLIPLFLFEFCIVLIRAKDPNIFQSLKAIKSNEIKKPKSKEHFVEDIELEEDVLGEIELDGIDLKRLELEEFNIEEPELAQFESEKFNVEESEIAELESGEYNIEEPELTELESKEPMLGNLGLEDIVLGNLEIGESVLEASELAKQKIEELASRVPELEPSIFEELALGAINLEELVKDEPIVEELVLEESMLDELGFKELLAEQPATPEPLLEIEEVPPQLRDLASMAVKWGIGDEDHRENIMKSASVKELMELSATVGPRMQEIANWLETLNDDQIKESDSARFFLFLMSAYDDAPLYAMEEIV